MKYPSSQVTVEAYASPIWAALGSFYRQFSEDKDFYRTLCESVVQGFNLPWYLIERQRAIVNFQGRTDAYEWPTKLLKFLESDSRLKSNGNRCVLIPSDLVTIQFLKNKFMQEDYSLTRGVDFEIEDWDGNRWLVFDGDPFLAEDFTIESTLDASNTVVDRELSAWAVNAETSLYPLERQWGSWLKMNIRDDIAAFATENVVHSLATGPAFSKLAIGAGRAYGHPVCEKAGETVEVIVSDSRGKLVITDQSAYRYPEDATIIVSVGDSLLLCQPISSGVRWYDPNRGEFPDLPGWAVDKNELGPNYSSGLIFPNEDLELQVTSAADRTKVAVELGGALVDQETFWSEVHTRGVSGGTTLANYLDTRPNPVGEPDASALPSTLNPYRLLADEAFRYAAVICVLDYSQGLDPAGTRFLAAWQNAMPSHQAIKSYVTFGGDVGVAASYTGEDPSVGLVMDMEIGYYGIGPYASAGGNPSITQEVVA